MSRGKSSSTEFMGRNFNTGFDDDVRLRSRALLEWPAYVDTQPPPIFTSLWPAQPQHAVDNFAFNFYFTFFSLTGHDHIICLGDNILILSHSVMRDSCSFNSFDIVENDFPLRMVVSSANCIKDDALGRSFIYNKNNKGPSIEPCGMPIFMLRYDEFTLL